MRMLIVAMIVGACRAPATPSPPAKAPTVAAPAITFAWDGHSLTSNAGITGLLDTYNRLRLELRGVPEGAVVSGDVYPGGGGDEDLMLFDVVTRASFDEVMLGPPRATMDVLARFTITLPDGRSGTTSLPPMEPTDEMLLSELVMPSTPSTDGPRDSMVYFHEDTFEVFGRRGRVADVDFLAHAEVTTVTSAECTYVIPIYSREEQRTITVRLDETIVTVNDRWTGQRIASRTWPAPASCPPTLAGVDLGGPINYPSGRSRHPYHEIHDWLAAWMRANTRM